MKAFLEEYGVVVVAAIVIMIIVVLGYTTWKQDS